MKISGKFTPTTAAEPALLQGGPMTFDDFWPLCRRKIDKSMCRILFNGITSPDGMEVQIRDKEGNSYKPHIQADAADIIDGMKAYRYASLDTEDKYIKHPATWLRHEGWEDYEDRADLAGKWDSLQGFMSKNKVRLEVV